MGALDIMGAAGTGIESFLGSPEQQRTRATQVEQFGQNLALHRDILNEQRRQHDLQFAPVDMTPEVNAILERNGEPAKPLGTYMVPRGRAGIMLIHQGFHGGLSSPARRQATALLTNVDSSAT